MAGYGNFTPVLGGGDLRPVGDEGSYFVALNTTPGTGIAGHAAPTTADTTKPMVYVKNGHSRGGPNIWLDYIGVRLTAVGANGTSYNFAAFVDTNATRTGGGSAITPKSTKQCAVGNPQDLNNLPGSKATIWFGDVVVTNGTAKQVGHRRVRATIPVVEDYVSFSFGHNTSGPMTTYAATLIAAHVMWAPICIAPGASFLLVNWEPAQNAANSYDLEVGYSER